MKKEDRELLLKDLSARLPYGVKCNVSGVHQPITLAAIDAFSDYPYKFGVVQFSIITNIKPYLRPMSSMTEEERLEYDSLIANSLFSPDSYETLMYKKLDWLNKRHIDYRGFIGKDLALPAPEDMYKY